MKYLVILVLLFATNAYAGPNGLLSQNQGGSSSSVVSSINGGAVAGHRNMLSNGDMRIDQRNVGASQTITAAAALAYTADRWFSYSTGGSPTGQRVAGPDAAHAYIYQFTGAASTTAIYFGQRIEATNSAWVAGNTVTLSFDASDSTLTSMTCALSYANTADTFGTVASPTVTAISSNTFIISSTLTRYTYTYTIPAAATTGLQVLCNVGAQTSGTWKLGNLQLEYGSTATPFERVPLSVAYVDAYRYFVSYGGYALQDGLGVAAAYSTVGVTLYLTLPTPMRVAPTMTVLNVGNWTVGANAATVMNLNAGNSTQVLSFNVQVASGLTTGGCYTVFANNSTAPRAQLSAEL